MNEASTFAFHLPLLGKLLCWFGWHRQTIHELPEKAGTTRTLYRCERCPYCRITVHNWADDRY